MSRFVELCVWFLSTHRRAGQGLAGLSDLELCDIGLLRQLDGYRREKDWA